jgi:hypothetical protein
MSPSNTRGGPHFYDQGTQAVLSLRDRLSKTFLKPPKPAPEAEKVRDRPMTDDEKRAWIRGLEPVERKWGFLLSAYAALVALYLNLPDIVSKHYVYEKVGNRHEWVLTNRSALLLLIVQLVLAAGIAAAAYFRKRPILGFFLLISAFASNVLGIPMLILAGWIFMRSWRVQRYGSTEAKVAAKASAERREAKKRGEKVPGLFSKASSTSSSTVDASSTVASGPRRASEASKRYTPPKPKKAEPKKRTPPAKSPAKGSSAKSSSAKSSS